MANDTKSALIEKATTLVRRRGYAGFSYADLSDAVGIRKASIHHHYPNKEDLGVAVVEAYRQVFRVRLEVIAAASEDPFARIDGYAGLHREGLALDQGCLCGVLASEIGGLPPRVRACVERFFDANLRWLERVVDEGREARRLRSDVDPRREARTILATMQGAMLLALAAGAPQAFEDAVSGLKAGLAPPTA